MQPPTPTAGEAYCWGLNSAGELGTTTATSYSNTASPVAGALTFATLIAGAYYTCGVTTAGTTYCWGSNWALQLGDGTSAPSSVPVRVAGQASVK